MSHQNKGKKNQAPFSIHFNGERAHFREFDRKNRPFSDGAANNHIPAMPLGDFLAYCESHPGALELFPAVQTLERLKNELGMSLLKTNPVVLHGDFKIRALRFDMSNGDNR